MMKRRSEPFYWAGPRAKEVFVITTTPVDMGLVRQMLKATGYLPLLPPEARVLSVK